MSRFPYDEVEIVGFEGTVSAECGRALPIGRHKFTGRFFRLSGDDSEIEQEVLYTRDEIDSYVEESRLTLLPKPMPAFPEAVVIYVTEKFLNAADYRLDDRFVHPYHRLQYRTSK